MFFKIIMYYLLGYATISVEGYFIERFINICISKNIILWNMKRKKSSFLFTNIAIKDFKKIRQIAKTTKCHVKIEKKKGLPFLLHRYKKRKIFLSLLIAIILIIIGISNFIWNIEIIGENNISKEELLQQLEEYGLKTGILKAKVDTKEIINKIRLARDDVAWIGIKMVGTNAIVEITIDEKPQIYIYSGKTYYQPEQSLSTITTQLTDEANEVEYLDILSTGSVPEDCDCLIITTLAEDMSEMERDKILEYIQRGGKILFLTSQNILDVDTPNLDAILSQYGISIEYGAIFEQDTTRMLQNAPEFPIVDVDASFMSDIGMNVKMCLVDAGNIEMVDTDKQEELSVGYEILASTGETSFIRTNFDTNSYTRTDADSEEGSFTVGVCATKKISDDISSEMIIYSNELCASDLQVPVSNQYYMYAVDLYNNKDIILNSISHLTERTDTITIRKTDETENYTVSEQEDTIIKIIIFTIPTVIIIIGLVVWQIRRRRK